MGFESGDFFIANVIVDLLEITQAGEFILQLGLHDGLGGLGEFFGAFFGDFFSPTHHFWDDFVFDGGLVEEAFGTAANERSLGDVHFVGHVFEGMIDDDTNGGGGEEAIHVQDGRCGTFGDESALDEQAIRFGSTPDSKGGVALFAAEEEVERAANERVVGGEESKLLTRECAGAVEGDGESFFGERGKGICDEFSTVQEVVAVREFFDMEAEEIEHFDEEGFELALFISELKLLDEFIDVGFGAGAEFEQAILTTGETGLQLGMC